MHGKNEYNIIHDYTYRNIKKYYDNKYITMEKHDFLNRCLKKIVKCNSFLHITNHYEEIIQSKKLICSSGGLGGVVYVTPLINDLYMHNLGEYILKEEIQLFNENNYNVSCIIIEKNKPKIGYVDYLEFGKIYYDIYNNEIDLKDLIDEHKVNIEKKLIIEKINNILSLSSDINNVDLIFSIMYSSKVLKIFLFECILEYLYLFQKQTDVNELNSIEVKRSMYRLCPRLKERFSLSIFEVKFQDLLNYIHDNPLYEIKNIQEYFTSRISDFLTRYLLNNEKNIIGHIVFREFDIRKQIEIKFANILWNEAKQKKYDVLTYIIPKGEMGILPFNDNTFIYLGKQNDKKVIKSEKIHVIIDKNIIKDGTMRNPYKEVYNMELPIKVQGVMYSIDNNKIEYLIIKRCEEDGGFWQGVTGTLEDGEKIIDCLKREIKEELGITNILNISELKQTIQWAKKTGFMITEYVFAVKLDKSVKVTLSEEHTDYKWCNFDEAYNTLEKSNNKNTLKIINEELLNDIK